ncbi:hypothetical protein A3Q56_07735 [Intoshia linei]|uniref:Tr-type G domain-containing protein n=1 Tax=Intoshia linei TaxID=1819745 RepID=A0A177ARV9_9BILA|nr:hypothetical protein A3Q56_07735 [Intoshia linei]
MSHFFSGNRGKLLKSQEFCPGHADCGKSTTIGRLLSDLKVLKSNELHKNIKETVRHGKSSFEYAYVMDTCEYER